MQDGKQCLGSPPCGAWAGKGRWATAVSSWPGMALHVLARSCAVSQLARSFITNRNSLLLFSVTPLRAHVRVCIATPSRCLALRAPCLQGARLARSRLQGAMRPGCHAIRMPHLQRATHSGCHTSMVLCLQRQGAIALQFHAFWVPCPQGAMPSMCHAFRVPCFLALGVPCF